MLEPLQSSMLDSINNGSSRQAGWHCFEIRLIAVALFGVLTKQC